jgi:hypothetical protein
MSLEGFRSRHLKMLASCVIDQDGILFIPPEVIDTSIYVRSHLQWRVWSSRQRSVNDAINYRTTDPCHSV